MTHLAALGRPGVAVRAHYGALPSMAGLGQTSGGESRCARVRDERAVASQEVTVPRTEIAAVERRKTNAAQRICDAALATDASFGAPPPPSFARGFFNRCTAGGAVPIIVINAARGAAALRRARTYHAEVLVMTDTTDSRDKQATEAGAMAKPRGRRASSMPAPQPDVDLGRRIMAAREKLARKLMRLAAEAKGLWRDCERPPCRRARTCRGAPQFPCLALHKAPPLSPEESASVAADILRALRAQRQRRAEERADGFDEVVEE